MIKRMWKDFIVATPIFLLVLYCIVLGVGAFFLLLNVVNEYLAIALAFTPWAIATTEWQSGSYYKYRERWKWERIAERNEMRTRDEKKDP